ncbi:hypothetical protein H9639_13815 [Arthrobacter sp. Sa2CUA1]|uniref:Lipoprotein n=1 Tax=Arthrobacter gallicola TaxID=2762225 RepID=A0ABR8UVH0_9MICC|nr:hypothetical protein [Arthrobacter gallicola]MBD7996377.1 hypothetical protein [Arthrobacter gallicola]
MRADKYRYTVTGTIAIALVLTTAGCTASGSPAEATPSGSSTSVTPTPSVPTAASSSPAPTTEAPSPSTPVPAPEVQETPTKQAIAPQPLGPQASAEDLAKAREALLDYGYSPEEAAAWPTLDVVVPDDAIDIIASMWGRGPNLTYEAALDPDRLVYIVTVIVRSPYDDGEPPVTAVWEVRSDGNYTWIA